jgi:Xaa-Pro dipeptidase
MQSGLGMTENRDYIFDDKMIFGFDAGIIYENYVSDTGLTVFWGPYNKRDLEIYKRLLSIIDEGFASMRPGVRCLDVYKAMKSKSNEMGMVDITFEGHGVGLSFREYPYINADVEYKYNNGFEKTSANFVLEKSMVINLELGYHIFGEKTFQIEKTILVTENGTEPITRQDRSLPIMIN